MCWFTYVFQSDTEEEQSTSVFESRGTNEQTANSLLEQVRVFISITSNSITLQFTVKLNPAMTFTHDDSNMICNILITWKKVLFTYRGVPPLFPVNHGQRYHICCQASSCNNRAPSVIFHAHLSTCVSVTLPNTVQVNTHSYKQLQTYMQ